MSHRRHTPQPVENYTTAFLCVTGVLIFMTLWTVAATAGTLWMLGTAIAMNTAITFLGRSV